MPMPHPDFERCARHLTEDAVRELLADMVDIPSPTGGEAQMARYLVKRMSAAGLETPLAGDRPRPGRTRSACARARATG